MKVLCINDDFTEERKRPNFKYIIKLPEELKEYSVKEIIDGGYVLNEFFAGVFPNNKEISFKTNRFIILADKSEAVEKEFCDFHILK